MRAKTGSQKEQKGSAIRRKEAAKMKRIKINAFKLNGSENEMTVLFISQRKTVIKVGMVRSQGKELGEWIRERNLSSSVRAES